MRVSIFAMTAICLGLASGAQAADLKVGLMNCSQHTCNGKTMRTYNFKKGETCNSVFAELNFVSVAQLQNINYKLSGYHFLCKNVRAGTPICYPQVKRAGDC